MILEMEKQPLGLQCGLFQPTVVYSYEFRIFSPTRSVRCVLLP